MGRYCFPRGTRGLGNGSIILAADSCNVFEDLELGELVCDCPPFPAAHPILTVRTVIVLVVADSVGGLLCVVSEVQRATVAVDGRQGIRVVQKRLKRI